jgi:hypothetical protein
MYVDRAALGQYFFSQSTSVFHFHLSFQHRFIRISSEADTVGPFVAVVSRDLGIYIPFQQQ